MKDKDSGSAIPIAQKNASESHKTLGCTKNTNNDKKDNIPKLKQKKRQ
jgi:hypothetical protein